MSEVRIPGISGSAVRPPRRQFRRDPDASRRDCPTGIRTVHHGRTPPDRRVPGRIRVGDATRPRARRADVGGRSSPTECGARTLDPARGGGGAAAPPCGRVGQTRSPMISSQCVPPSPSPLPPPPSSPPPLPVHPAKPAETASAPPTLRNVRRFDPGSPASDPPSSTMEVHARRRIRFSRAGYTSQWSPGRVGRPSGPRSRRNSVVIGRLTGRIERPSSANRNWTPRPRRDGRPRRPIRGPRPFSTPLP